MEKGNYDDDSKQERPFNGFSDVDIPFNAHVEDKYASRKKRNAADSKNPIRRPVSRENTSFFITVSLNQNTLVSGREDWGKSHRFIIDGRR